MKVWPSQTEVDQLIAQANGTQQRIGFSLGIRCGLRGHEVLDVAPEDVVDTDARASSSLLDVTSTRSLRRWIQNAAESLQDETGDAGWDHLGFHNLRRTWATALASADVDALLVCDWGGWNDLETFLEHYRGTYSPEAQQRERGKSTGFDSAGFVEIFRSRQDWRAEYMAHTLQLRAAVK